MKKILQRNFSEDHIKQSYARVVWLYDFWSWLTESKAAQKVIALSEIREGENILEVAIGTGKVFEQVVKHNQTGRNEGIDLSPGMLARAEERLRDYDKNCFNLRMGSAYHLSFEAGSFDLIINNYMFDLFPENDFAAVLAEFQRVLKPTGRIVISTMAFGRKWYNTFWDRIAAIAPGLLTGCRPVSLQNYLTKTGFEIVHIEYISQNTFPSEVIKAVNNKKG